MNYYNEHDPKAAAWLRELIAQGHLPPGFVDSRDIQLAGVPTTTRLWTGSCPCQPFSVAGKGLGKRDPRHLWPQFRRLIRLCRPPVVFGEQVASAAGRIWLSGVCADLEALAYRTAAADLCAAGGSEDCEIGILRGDSPLAWERATLSAPHLRQRLWWCAGRLADSEDSHRRSQQSERPARRWWDGPAGMRSTSGLGLSNSPRWEPGQSATTSPGHGYPAEPAGGLSQPGPASGRMAHAEHAERGPQHGPGENECHRHDAGRQRTHRQSGACGPLCDSSDCHGLEITSSGGLQDEDQQPGDGRQTAGIGQTDQLGIGSPWSHFDLIPCRDGKARRIESGTFPLVDGLPGRVGLLRGYGNAIVPQRAADFIQAALEALAENHQS